jgi:hypothetical protein
MERIRPLGRKARFGVTLLATGRKLGTGLVMPWLLVLRLYVLFSRICCQFWMDESAWIIPLRGCIEFLHSTQQSRPYARGWACSDK